MNINFFDNIGLDNKKVFISMLVVAGVVYLLRMLPIVVFKKKIKNTFLNSFLTYVPYGVIASLLVPEAIYCLAAVKSSPTAAELLTAFLGLAISAFLAYKNRGLGLVIVASIATVFIVSKLLPLIPFFS